MCIDFASLAFSELTVTKPELTIPNPAILVDVPSLVLARVANTALLTIGNNLRFLNHARLRSSSLPGPSTQHRLETSKLLEDQETIEQRRQRSMIAFKFVQVESEFAAKPRDFGLRQVDSGAFSGSIETRGE